MVASVGLVGLAGLHVIWAAGASWPLPDTASLSDAVIGHDKFPSSTACLTVAGALAIGSAFVAGLPAHPDWLQRIGATGVAGVLATRGVLGVAGMTRLISQGSSSLRFRQLDRRLYSPLCLTLAALAAPATSQGGSIFERRRRVNLRAALTPSAGAGKLSAE